MFKHGKDTSYFFSHQYTHEIVLFVGCTLFNCAFILAELLKILLYYNFCILLENIKCFAESFCYDSIEIILAGFKSERFILEIEFTQVLGHLKSGLCYKIFQLIQDYLVLDLCDQIYLVIMVFVFYGFIVEML